MVLLREAAGKGYHDAAKMAKDEALASLRSREDFQKQLNDLDAKTSTK